MIPLGRFEVPKDLMGTAFLLASEASDSITGQTIFCGWRIDGNLKLFNKSHKAGRCMKLCSDFIIMKGGDEVGSPDMSIRIAAKAVYHTC